MTERDRKQNRAAGLRQQAEEQLRQQPARDNVLGLPYLETLSGFLTDMGLPAEGGLLVDDSQSKPGL